MAKQVKASNNWMPGLGPVLQLPWSVGRDEDAKFRKTVLLALLLFLIFGAIIPGIDVPEPEREELEELPPQLAKILMEKKELPPPPPPPEPPKKEEKKPEEKKEEPKPEPKPDPKPEPEPEPEDTIEKARDTAAAEIMEFQDDLMEMRDTLDVEELAANDLSNVEAEAATVERSIITGKAAGTTSGGINTSKLSKNTGGTALSGRKTTKVVGAKNGTGKAGGRKRGSGASGKGKGSGRSDESVRRVMDRNKGAIFSIYNRALRQDPALQGKVTVKLVIEPNGSVSNCTLVSSDLQNPALESKLIARIRLINFGAENVARTTVNYSFDFLPF